MCGVDGFSGRDELELVLAAADVVLVSALDVLTCPRGRFFLDRVPDVEFDRDGRVEGWEGSTWYE